MAQEGNPTVRRSTRNLVKKSIEPATIAPAIPTPAASNLPYNITTLPPSSSLTTKLTGLPKRDLTLLQHKQRLLQQQTSATSSSWSSLTAVQQAALSATLVFAQSEAGTAFCISPTGVLLTCSHCVAEVEDGAVVSVEDIGVKYLLFADGRVVAARCIAYDGIRDLALLQITAAQPALTSSPSLLSGGSIHENNVFPYLKISPTAPNVPLRLFCIGHPGSEDLESATPRKTNYDILHISTGRYRGVAEHANVHDNSTIGALMHDCWTYWGHSGAPLCRGKDGVVVGVHSSWDEGCGMRRGIHWAAITGFLEEMGMGIDGQGRGTVGEPIVID
ncbi:hypothetical protein ABW21_db0203602 [Orbilia brochopaga]|nr:hypothetical protein ABW21_db0203602 [Drechslerella brochopaga]